MRYLIGFLIFLSAFFQNCSKFESETSLSSKQKITSSKVFVPMVSVDQEAMGTLIANGGGSGVSTDLSDCLGTGECEATGTLYVVTPPMTINLPVRYYCSNNWTDLAGNKNTKTSSSLKVALVDQNNRVACEVTSADFKKSVMNEKHLRAVIPQGSCPLLTNGRYTLLAVDATQSINVNPAVRITSRTLIIGNDNHDKPKALQVDATISSAGILKLVPVSGSQAFILYKENQGGAANADCEQVNSPLVVQLTPRPRKLRLTAPSDGVKFNIIGERDTPVNTLRQISWFNSADSVSHYFITLPDASGAVNGINELFGNNTRGPDGAFAANGYAALAKWDGRRSDGSYNKDARDGVIDKKDEVFMNMRFWSDRNLNGIAETMELYRVEEVGLVSVDLNFDPNFSETDRWGNEIKMKSTVRSVDNTLYLMYDIWYRRVD